jgi:OOP family OmpA-OmpF porin
MKYVLTAALLGASLASGAALAQQSQVAPYAAGPYVGASLLYNNYETDDCPGDCDKTDIGGKVFGGFMFTPYIGAELAYASYGKAKLNANVSGINVLGELKSSGVTGFLVAQYPIENFRVFGKLGFAWLDNEVNIRVPNVISIDESDTSTEIAYGLGATFMFNRNLGIRGEWERLRYKWEGRKESLNVFSVGVQYSF